jgi:hypothetical protein
MQGILVDDNGDLMVRNGSMAIGECSADVAQRVIISWTGEFKHAPLLGGNAKQMIAGKVDPFWKGHLKTQLRTAKVNTSNLKINEQGIEVIINYEL